MAFTLWSDDYLDAVTTTNIPTFEILMRNGHEMESVYFSQDEQASIDQDQFDAIGFAYVDRIMFGDGPVSVYAILEEDLTNTAP